MKGTWKQWLAGLVVMLVTVVSVAEDEEAPPPQVQYHDLAPPFVTNFGVSSTKLKYVKAAVSVRATSQSAVNEVIRHDPLVRHQIVMLLSRQDEATITSSAGQEAIRTEALKLVQDALQEETGSTQIDDLLFTQFVVQR